MRFSVYLSLAALLLVSVYASDVAELTDDTFDTHIISEKFTFVKFYAPWCGHCKTMAPDWEQLATDLKGEVSIANVDCTVHSKLAEAHQIRGFPTLKLFIGEDIIPYEGERSLAAPKKWVTKMTTSPTTKLEDASDVAEFQKNLPVSAVAYVSNDEEQKLVDNLARKTLEFEFGSASDSLNGGKAGLSLTKAYGSESFVSLNGLTVDSALEWINANGQPPIAEMSPQVWQRYSARKQPIVVAVIDYADEEQKKNTIELLEKIAPAVKVSISYGSSANLAKAVEQFGGTGKVFPALIGLLAGAAEEEKFANAPPQFNFDEKTPFTEENIKHWLEEVGEGKQKVIKKSEPIPESNDGDVFVLVADQYDKILAAYEYVFIEFYAPWCGHCKNLAPVYDEVGNHFKGNNRLLVAKIDATANYVDAKLGVTGFPTLILFQNGKVADKYNGQRDRDSIVTYLESKLNGGAAADSHSHDEL